MTIKRKSLILLPAFLLLNACSGLPVCPSSQLPGKPMDLMQPPPMQDELNLMDSQLPGSSIMPDDVSLIASKS